MKKVLFVATVVKAHIMAFHIPYLKMFKEMGWETSVAASNDYENPIDCVIPYCDEYYNIPFERNPMNISNIKAYRELKKIIDKGNYDIIHCHTPVGGVLTRIAAINARGNGTKVIYTAHGFHFYKGASLKNWIVFFPIERLCSYFTDIIVTINSEDYALSLRKMRAAKKVYVPGVGIEIGKFATPTVDRATKRKELGIPENVTLFLSVGELNENKNHETFIRAITDLKNIYYIIAGKGILQEHLQKTIDDLGLSDRVKLLGYRKDIGELCVAADAFAFPSFREGLAVAVMEAMASGLPVICSSIRGNTDLIDEKGGVLFDPHSIQSCTFAVNKLLKSDMSAMGAYNAVKIQDFSIEKVSALMKKIYFEE